MNKFIKISVVTPCFNMGDYIDQTINSILSQNYPNLEYIIVDGGSTDNTIEIIKKYENRITKWISEPDNGIYDALNKGFKHCTGEVMAWLNADDLYHPGCFSLINDIFLENCNVNWLTGIPSIFDEKGRTVKVLPFRNWSKLDFLFGDYKWIQQESVFWRRSLWENSGAYVSTKFKFASDLELWNRFFDYDNLFVSNALLGGFRIRCKNQLSLDHSGDYEKEVSLILGKNYQFLKNKEYTLYLILLFLKRLKFSKFNILRKIYRIIFTRKNIHKIFSKYHDSQTIIFERLTQKFILTNF